MSAHPQVGDRYYQEFARNVAEDQAKVLSLKETVCPKVPAPADAGMSASSRQEGARTQKGQ